MKEHALEGANMNEFKTESKKLLDLMINSIYANHEVFLRELVSNASDALDKARLAQSSGTLHESDDLGIHIAIDQEARTLTVSDTGIGMDRAALETCLGTIAHSESQRIKSEIAQADAPADIDLIGQFGVGFYSAFMVADEVTVISRAQGDDEAHRWKSNGVDGYTIMPTDRTCCGTDVILRIRQSTIDKNFERYLDQTSIQNLIRKYSNYIRYPITMDLAEETFGESGALVRDEGIVTREVINAMTPLWALDEQDVSQDDLEEFYRTEFHDMEAPLRSIRAHARGAIEYDALLYIPQSAPAELFSKDYRYGLKLYSAGVLIDERYAGLVSSHFRFVQGIVDTNNIDLNVSREMIQEDSRIQIIGRQIERSIMDSLKAMIEDERDEYEKFFNAFGTGLRYAICTSQGTLTEVLNGLLLYYSAKEQRLVTLQEYLDATENSKHTEIFYAVGSDVDRLAKAPNVRAVVDRGHDVLLCPHGAQDEMCFMVMGSYKGARFHSVTSANLEIGNEDEADSPNAQEGPEHGPVFEALLKQSPQPLIRIVASKYLTKPTQAAARVATEGIMTISMAKYIATKHDKDQLKKPIYVLELNTSHVLFAMAEGAKRERDEQALRNCVTVMLGQALLAEDIPLADPVAFNEATNALLSRQGAIGPKE